MLSDSIPYTGRWNALDESCFQACEELLKEFRYKPGWQFDLERAPEWGGLKLRVSFGAPDSRAPLRDRWFPQCPMCHQSTNEAGQIPITGTYYLPSQMAEHVLHGDERHFWRFIRYAIDSTENHETDEWFRVRGELVNDPHE